MKNQMANIEKSKKSVNANVFNFFLVFGLLFLFSASNLHAQRTTNKWSTRTNTNLKSTSQTDKKATKTAPVDKKKEQVTTPQRTAMGRGSVNNLNSKSTDKMVGIKYRGNNYYFNALTLKEGKNYRRLTNNSTVEIVKHNNKVTSIRTQMGRSSFGGNLLLANPGQGFHCDTNYCTCTGDADCNDLMGGDLCKLNGPIVDGECDSGSGTCWCRRR